MPHTTTQLQWPAEHLWEQLEPWLPGLSVEVLARCPSTNTALLERARAELNASGAPSTDTSLAQVRPSRESAAFGRRAADVSPCLLVAEQQTHGRGRQGRTWVSAEVGASLTFSLALPLRGDLSGLSLAVGLALAEALEPSPIAAPRVQLKWPNDLWLMDGPQDGPTAPATGRKLGGVLIETVNIGGTRLVVIGVGINVQPLAATPHHSSGYTHGHAALHELDATLTAPIVLQRMAPPLVLALLEFQRHGFTPCAAAYAQRDLLRGHPITTTQADTPEGIAQGVASNGALLVQRADGSLSTVHSGEVSVRLQTTPLPTPTASTTPITPMTPPTGDTAC